MKPKLAIVGACLCALTSVLLPVAEVGAASGDAVGPELRVDLGGYAARPSVAMDPYGRFAIAWASRSADGTATDIFVRLFDEAGGATSGPIRVTVDAATNARAPDIAVGPDGNFVVAWIANDGSGSGIYARRYWSWGEPMAEAMQVNTFTANDQNEVALAIGGLGQFIVAWTSWYQEGDLGEIYARVYNASGDALTDSLQINNSTAHHQGQPAVCMNANGDFAVAWVGDDLPHDNTTLQGIIARRFDRTGQPREGEVHVNQYAAGQQWAPAVRCNDDLSIVVAWQSSGQDGSSDGIYARTSGQIAGGSPEFRVNTTTAFGQRAPALSGQGLDGFTIAWQSQNQDGSLHGVYLQAYAADGTPLRGEQRVNTTTHGDQTAPALACDADGDLVVAWQSAPSAGDPASTIHAQRFSGPELVDVALSVEGPALVHRDHSWALRFRIRNNHPGYVHDPVGGATGIELSFWPSGLAELGDLPPECAGSQPVVCRVFPRIGPNWSEDYVLGLRAPGVNGSASVAAAVSSGQDDPDRSNNYVELTTQFADLEPDPFDFEDLREVSRNTLQISNSITVTGIDSPVAISGGPYSINGGPFTTAQSTVQAGDQVRLQHVSANTWSTTRWTYVSIGLRSGAFSSTTAAADVTPAPFAFEALSDVSRNTMQVSNAVMITGIDDPVSITVTGGEYSINGGAFTNVPRTISNGQTVRVRHISSSEFLRMVSSTLRVGTVSETFSTTTAALDQEPDAFIFSERTGVPRDSLVTSDRVLITGINDPTPISITNGSYSIDDGAFTQAPGLLAPGQSVRVQVLSAADFSLRVEATLAVGGVSGVFAVTTEDRDIVPDTFFFAERVAVERGSEIVSDEIVIAGINDPTSIGVEKGKYSVDGGPFVNRVSTVTAGQRVRVRHMAADDFSASKTTTLVIGGVRGDFRSTTVARDAEPDAFSFEDRTGVLPGTTVTSNGVRITGINDVVPIALTVSGSQSGGVLGSVATYSINGSAFTSAPGNVTSGDTVVLRVRAPLEPGAAIRVTVDIGDSQDVWQITTGP